MLCVPRSTIVPKSFQHRLSCCAWRCYTLIYVLWVCASLLRSILGRFLIDFGLLQSMHHPINPPTHPSISKGTVAGLPLGNGQSEGVVARTDYGFPACEWWVGWALQLVSFFLLLSSFFFFQDSCLWDVPTGGPHLGSDSCCSAALLMFIDSTRESVSPRAIIVSTVCDNFISSPTRLRLY